MSSKPFQAVLWTLLIVASAAGLAVGALENRRLRRRVAALRQSGERAVRMRDDNRRTRELLARAAADESDGARAIQTDLMRARAEVSDLEARARESRRQMGTQAAQDAASLAHNRDPEKGLTRLEHFRDVGQGTPGAAFQTFVWAAMKGEDAHLAGMIAFGGAAREKAEGVIAALPDEARVKYPTPEKLAALFFASVLTATPAIEIVDVSMPEAHRAVVSVRGLTPRTEKIPLQQGAGGWQIFLAPGMADKLGGFVRGGAPPSGR